MGKPDKASPPGVPNNANSASFSGERPVQQPTLEQALGLPTHPNEIHFSSNTNTQSLGVRHLFLIVLFFSFSTSISTTPETVFSER